MEVVPGAPRGSKLSGLSLDVAVLEKNSLNHALFSPEQANLTSADQELFKVGSTIPALLRPVKVVLRQLLPS
jgi:hypothetical protein